MKKLTPIYSQTIYDQFYEYFMTNRKYAQINHRFFFCYPFPYLSNALGYSISLLFNIQVREFMYYI